MAGIDEARNAACIFLSLGEMFLSDPQIIRPKVAGVFVCCCGVAQLARVWVMLSVCGSRECRETKLVVVAGETNGRVNLAGIRAHGALHRLVLCRKFGGLWTVRRVPGQRISLPCGDVRGRRPFNSFQMATRTATDGWISLVILALGKMNVDTAPVYLPAFAS